MDCQYANFFLKFFTLFLSTCQGRWRWRNQKQSLIPSINITGLTTPTRTFFIWKIKQLPGLGPYHHSPCTEEKGRPEGISRGRGGSSWRRCSGGGQHTSLRSAKPTPLAAKSVVLESPSFQYLLHHVAQIPPFLKVSALTLPLAMTASSTHQRRFPPIMITLTDWLWWTESWSHASLSGLCQRKRCTLKDDHMKTFLLSDQQSGFGFFTAVKKKKKRFTKY